MTGLEETGRRFCEGSDAEECIHEPMHNGSCSRCAIHHSYDKERAPICQASAVLADLRGVLGVADAEPEGVE